MPNKDLSRWFFKRKVPLKGDRGDAGQEGAQGPSGIQGNPGAAGAPGSDGRSVLNGTTNPSGGTGSNGDFYINTTTWQIFGPKSGGAWPGGQNIQGIQGIQGVPGPNTLPVTSINTSPGRTLNSNYQIHATRPAIVVYSVQLHTVLTLIGTSSAKVELRSDTSTPPTTARSEVMHQINIGVGISVNQQSDVISNLAAFIAAGDNVRLVPTLVNGGTAALTRQLEIVL